MGQAKEKLMEEQLKNSKNWITRKCIQCGEDVKINIVLDPSHADPTEPCICQKCRDKD